LLFKNFACLPKNQIKELNHVQELTNIQDQKNLTPKIAIVKNDSASTIFQLLKITVHAPK
jgi:hypothetical protein